MNKKIVLIILLVILILIIFGIYNFLNDENKNEIINNVNSENVVENKQENIINNEEENKENTTTINENTNETFENEVTNNNMNKTIVNQVSPSGFMGSSLYRVILYSNGEVYVEKFDGNGYEEENIISNDLIAKNVESIKAATDDEHYGEVIVKGGETVNNNFGWIDFE